jgi:hypothetical protein
MLYLQYGVGDSVDNPTIEDVQDAIKSMKTVDEEHGAFWVATDDEEYVLEASLHLRLVLIEGEEDDKRLSRDWEQVLDMYRLLFSGDYARLKSELARMPKW